MQRSPEHQNPNSLEEIPKVEKVESSRDIIHSEINEMLRSVRKQNEGAAGIIMKLDAVSFSPRMLNALEKLGVSVTEDTAAKLLKVYSPGAARHEFTMQQRAYSAVENAENSLSLAKIPEPLFYSDVPVESDVADNLRAQDIDLHDSNRVEIVLMDWIPGQDLLTQMFKKALEYFPDHPALPSDPDDFRQLRYSASIILGLEAPDLNVITAEQKENNEAITYRRNIDKLLRFLEKKGQYINPKVSKQLDSTVNQLHINGIWHNDIHERNVVATGDIFDNTPDAELETYLIDFGTATSSAQERMVSDKDLVQTIERASNIVFSFETKLAEAKESATSNPRYASTLAMIKQASNKLPLNGIEASYSLFSDDDGLKTVVALNQLIEDKIVTSEQVKEKINEILNRPNDKRFTRRKNLKEYIGTLN